MEIQEDNKLMKPPSWKEQNYFPARYIISLMAFLGMTCNFMLNVNINFAIQVMVKPGNDTNSTIDDLDVCNFTDSDSGGSDYGGDFEWDEVIQGFVVGAFYWGYIWTQIPGGRLAEVYGPKIMMGCCLGTTSILALFIPLAAHSSYIALIAVRVLQGLIQGPMYPVALVLVSTWAPPAERSMLTTFVCAGDSFGTIIAFPMAAAIADSINWEAIFYIQASISLCWVILWFLLISDDPKTFRFMTDTERKYISSSIGESKSKKSPPIPWRYIALSMPFWAMVVAGLGDSWGWYTLLTELPLYMKEMLKMDMATNALLSSMPYLGAWIFGLTSSIIGDKLIQSGTISTGLVRKIAQTLAHMGPGIALFVLTFMQCDKNTSIALFFVGIAFQGVAYVGFIANAVDIAPNFAGTLYGIVGMLATIPGVIAPLTVGLLTQGQQTFSQWNKVFYLTFGIYCFDVLFYWLFGSGEEQPWNKVTSTDKDGLHLVEKQSNTEDPKLKPSHIDVGHDNLNFKDTEEDSHKIVEGEIKVDDTKRLSSQDGNNIVEEPGKVEITVYESSQDEHNSFEESSKDEGAEKESTKEVEEPNDFESAEQESVQDVHSVIEKQIKDKEDSQQEPQDEQRLVEEQSTIEGEEQDSLGDVHNLVEEQSKDEDIEHKQQHDIHNLEEDQNPTADTHQEPHDEHSLVEEPSMVEATEQEPQDRQNVTDEQNIVDIIEQNLEDEHILMEENTLVEDKEQESHDGHNLMEVKSMGDNVEQDSKEGHSLVEEQIKIESTEHVSSQDGNNIVEELSEGLDTTQDATQVEHNVVEEPSKDDEQIIVEELMNKLL